MPIYDFKNPRKVARRPLYRGAGAPVVLLLLVALGSIWASGGRSDLEPVPVAVAETTDRPAEERASAEDVEETEATAPEFIRIEGRIGRDEVFSEALKREGLHHEAVFEVVGALRKGIHRDEFNPNIVQTGDRYAAEVDSLGRIQSFEFTRSGLLDTRFLAQRRKGVLAAWKETVPLDRRLVVIAEELEDTMWGALAGTGQNAGILTDKLTDIFEYEIDFMVDCRRGDRFALVFEAFYKDGEFIRYGDILAAEYRSGADAYQAFRYVDPEGNSTYYDEDGRSLRGIFLKSPLDYRRISSGYTSRRYHPVLKKYLAHHGIDYAADYGTPVWATADGTISHVGRKGALGHYVEIRHKNGYKTGYGHLSRYRKGLREGAFVKEKDVIGYVGATGRATGPHLHYNFYETRNGSYRLTNPANVIKPTGKPVPSKHLQDFRTQRDRLYSLLDNTSGTDVTALLENGPAAGNNGLFRAE